MIISYICVNQFLYIYNLLIYSIKKQIIYQPKIISVIIIILGTLSK